VLSSNSFLGNYFFTPLENFRKRLYTILVSEKRKNPTNRLLNSIIILLIIINIAAIILETVKSIYEGYKIYFDIIEIYTLTIFAIEYFTHLWICTLNPRYQHPIWGRLKFMMIPMVMIELIVIMPLFISLVSEYDFRYLAILRFAMVLRIFKLEKYSHALLTFKRVIQDKKEELVLTLTALIVLLILTSCTMYLIEKDVNEDFSSIPETMWWATSTLTTVGYGDVVPQTPLGKFLGSVIAILGIAMFAIPAGLISSSFTEQVQARKKKKSCPHCGNDLH